MQHARSWLLLLHDTPATAILARRPHRVGNAYNRHGLPIRPLTGQRSLLLVLFVYFSTYVGDLEPQFHQPSLSSSQVTPSLRLQGLRT